MLIDLSVVVGILILEKLIMIDKYVSNIEKSFDKNNIQSAFQLIYELKKSIHKVKKLRIYSKKINLNILKK